MENTMTLWQELPKKCHDFVTATRNDGAFRRTKQMPGKSPCDKSKVLLQISQASFLTAPLSLAAHADCEVCYFMTHAFALQDQTSFSPQIPDLTQRTKDL